MKKVSTNNTLLEKSFDTINLKIIDIDKTKVNIDDFNHKIKYLERDIELSSKISLKVEKTLLETDTYI